MSLADLERHERKIHSQNGEDGVIEAIFAAIGVTNRYFVEFDARESALAMELNVIQRFCSNKAGMGGANQSRNPLVTVHQEFQPSLPGSARYLLFCGIKLHQVEIGFGPFCRFGTLVHHAKTDDFPAMRAKN